MAHLLMFCEARADFETVAPLDLLRARGHATGLTAFLDDVAQTVIPLVSGVSPVQRPHDAV